MNNLKPYTEYEYYVGASAPSEPQFTTECTTEFIACAFCA